MFLAAHPTDARNSGGSNYDSSARQHQRSLPLLILCAMVVWSPRLRGPREMILSTIQLGRVVFPGDRHTGGYGSQVPSNWVFESCDRDRRAGSVQRWQTTSEGPSACGFCLPRVSAWGYGSQHHSAGFSNLVRETKKRLMAYALTDKGFLASPA
jgi:hypothetical protein